MTDAPRPADSRTLHIVALMLAVLSVVAFFALPGGVIDYLIMTACAAAAVFFGIRGVLRPGALRWVVLAGGIVAMLILVTSIGLLVIRVTRVLTSDAPF
ncbi:Trk-type K+ transport systems, membrane components [Microbacterium testaceum StLB037]|uniref:Trk-type K+ transport systems, membrane components n=1 Tax=Microbacterium testaceum (strain StLB037) TaxID=979556 RepID=E8NGN0_MICTS|nr:hypothetical protein [Microbacterium testaceum]BAJ75329.1 Trk-type K+ transport systems, membrane components [Microbacterium testaceum StLB037]